MDQRPRLRCEQCQRRKIKCDKGTPCTACKHAGLKCNVVQRARFPRGRSGKAGGRTSLLESRVARIEDLLKQADVVRVPSNNDGKYPNSDLKDAEDTSHSSYFTSKIRQFVAPDFWDTLSQEVAGLRETFESSGDEDGAAKETHPIGNAENASSVGAILFNHSPSSTDFLSLSSPPEPLRTTLLNLYRHRVDSVYKVTHWPTVVAYIEEIDTNPQYCSKFPSVRALEFAVYFMALCSITDDESEKMSLGNRVDLVRQYRSATETFISKASLLGSPDLAVLQAFVIYLLGLRTCLSCATTWTLLAVAVRVANALGLGREDSRKISAFDLQLRRRLWFCIGVLDIQTALDRGSAPLLSSGNFQTPPLCINDCEMSSESVPKLSSHGFTDMSFSAMTQEGMVCFMKICESPGEIQAEWEDWTHKLQVVTEFEHSMRQKCAMLNDSASPLERLAKLTAEEVMVSMQLLLRRPPYRRKRNIVPPWDHFDVMEVGTEVLERSIRLKDSDLAPWAWKNWVKWYALAVVLAELCGRPDGAASERAYSVAQECFRRYASLIADNDTGMLWKPIAKLMKRVQRLKGSASEITNGVRTQNLPASSTEFVQSLDGPDPNLSADLDLMLGQLGQNPSAALYTISGNTDQGSGHDIANMLTQSDDNDQMMYMSNDLGFGNGVSWINWDLFLEDANSLNNSEMNGYSNA